MNDSLYLRVVTLNAGSCLEPHWAARRIEIVEWVARLNPDIVCLQEIWQDGTTQNTAEWLVDQLGNMWHWVFGGYPFAFAPSQHPESVRFGSAILSRWPIDMHAVYPLPVDLHPVVEHPAWTLQLELLHARTCGIDVYSTHLAPAPAQAYHRIRQVISIDETVQATADPQAVCGPIICGDFNAEPESDEIRFLSGYASIDGKSTYYQDVWRASGNTAPGYTSDWRTNPMNVPFNVPMKRIDYIFVGDSFQKPLGAGLVMNAQLAFHEPLTGITASDHFGIVAEIRWPQKPTPQTESDH
jgi:endonuclease/exonuclease/phosphatase family metal-dependent hydrolase